MTGRSYSEVLAGWSLSLEAGDLPPDIIETTKLRLLDTIGLMIAATASPLGQAARAGALTMGSGSDSRIVGFGDRTSAMLAALVNGTLAHAEDFDDTHGSSLVHPSAAVVSGALAMAEKVQATGKELLVTVAMGNEVSCRLGAVAPMAFHKRGLHPTGLLTGFAAALGAGRLMGLDVPQLRSALGIHGSQAAGLLESFADGTWVKTMHPGWAALGGIAAAHLAAKGFTGPASVLEGRFGLYSAFAGDVAGGLQLEGLVQDLGREWELRQSSIKPYPCAHVIHPFVDLALALRVDGLRAEDVASITLPIAEKYIGVVAEPRNAKVRPATPTHARASLPYCVAAALHFGHCGSSAFTEAALKEGSILSISERIMIVADPTPSAPGQFRGRIVVDRNDGQRMQRVQEHHRGSPENPLSRAEVEMKFEGNVERLLAPLQRRTIQTMIDDLTELDCVTRLIDNYISHD